MLRSAAWSMPSKGTGHAEAATVAAEAILQGKTLEGGRLNASAAPAT